MSRIEITLRLSESLHEQARGLARARGETLWDMAERALRREIARLDRFGPTSVVATPDIVADLRDAQSWPELLARLRGRGLSLRADTDAVTLFRLVDGARVDLPREGADAVEVFARLGVPPGETLLLWDRDRTEDPAVATGDRAAPRHA